MRIDEIIEALRKDLDPWVKSQRGVLSVAKDPYHALEILANAPQGLQFVLGWGGDEAEGDQEEAPLAHHIIELSVAQNVGLTVDRDEALFAATAGRTSLLRIVDAARARLLTARFPENVTGRFLAYAGAEPITLPDGMPLAAYRLRARLLAAVETDAAYRDLGSS